MDETSNSRDMEHMAQWAMTWTAEDPPGDFVEAIRLINVLGKQYLVLTDKLTVYKEFYEAAEEAQPKNASRLNNARKAVKQRG